MPKRTNDGIKKRCAHKCQTWNDCACPWWFGFFRADANTVLADEACARPGRETATVKGRAILWRDRLRSEIGAGTFVDPDETPRLPAPVDSRLTFGDVCEKYLKRHVRIPTRRPIGKREMEIHIAVLRDAEIGGANGATVKLAAKTDRRDHARGRRRRSDVAPASANTPNR